MSGPSSHVGDASASPTSSDGGWGSAYLAAGVLVVGFGLGASLAAVFRWGAWGLGFDLAPIEVLMGAFVAVLVSVGLGFVLGGVARGR